MKPHEYCYAMRKGDPIHYRSISGQIYPGTATCDRREDGTVGVRVYLDFHKIHPIELSRVQAFDRETEQTYTAWPR